MCNADGQHKPPQYMSTRKMEVTVSGGGGGGGLQGGGGGIAKEAASRSTKRSTHARPGMHMQQCSAVLELPVRIMGSVMQAMYRLSNFTFLSVAGPCFVGQNL